MRIGVGLPVLMASVLIATVAGCDSSTAGQPTGVGNESGPASESAEPTESSSRPDPTTTSSAPTFSNAALCQLLTEEEAQQLGGSPTGEPGSSTADGHPQCQWSADTTLVIGFQEGVQSKDAKTGPGITNTPTTVAGLPAVQSRETDPVEICQVLVDITDKSMLGVSVATLSGGEGKYVPCDVSNELVNIVIPKVQQR